MGPYLETGCKLAVVERREEKSSDILPSAKKVIGRL